MNDSQKEVDMRVFSLLMVLLLGFSPNVFAHGGNSGGGGDTDQVSRGAVQMLLLGDGLKKAMLNYLGTVKFEQIDDSVVRAHLTDMIKKKLLDDIQNSKYVLATPTTPCKDAFNREVPAATQVGELGSDVCFDVDKLLPELKGLSEEDIMVRIAGLAFHEHTHHYQVFAKEKVQANEDLANRIGGYILITAKFVQLPLLRWVKPESGPADFQIIQTMYSEIKARERAFIAPKPSDFADYPDFRGKDDRGVIRLLPHEKYDGKMSINGGGSFYSFARLDHGYGYGSDIGFARETLRVGFAGCNFGYFTSVGTLDLNQINDSTPGMKFLTALKPGPGEPAIRMQQTQREVESDGMLFTATIQKIKAGQTYLLRSINFGESDVLVAFKILRFDTDGSLILAWKRLRSFPVSECK